MQTWLVQRWVNNCQKRMSNPNSLAGGEVRDFRPLGQMNRQTETILRSSGCGLRKKPAVFKLSGQIAGESLQFRQSQLAQGGRVKS